ncbi:deoxyribodipyrimidine photo-lyase [Thioalkalivibrio sp. XN8]|uniref:cryptochrome/photolyase family protein n=1 Tax=Thioalkalivibrio sp. XN8 TaxID=2712863 RepID=UPI0013EE0059|nr:deoxyribodipyrimidine photo-lyase [Thioalkalivibrio sp. XN8]NGP52413.1 deoxyribodipyrimidine photo-lyase [Thioalkalivibrio sp. XN8]
MKLAIHWFRRDLRLTDNPALRAALEAAETVLPVYVWSPEDEGEWAPGGAGRWWLYQSLAALDACLRERGSRLLLRAGPAAQVLAKLVAETGAEAVYWNRLYEPALVERDRGLKGRLRAQGIAAHSCKASLLYEPWELETGKGAPYRVFTPFWKAALAQPDPPPPRPAPDALQPPPAWPPGLELEALELLPATRWYDGLQAAWRPGEAGALARLEGWCEEPVGRYATERDRPGIDGTSALSPHLHFGELSPRQAWAAAAARRSELPGRGIDAWLRELGWREFAHHVLYHFPHTPTEPMYAKYAAFPWREDHEEMLQRWQRGQTGIPIVDAGLRQLWATGWMHNRVRMIAASLLVKNIRAPWQEGARWFWDTLVDADLANNTMGWQWTAGSGADAAPYFRIFNPVTQGEKFDPEGRYVQRWIPELRALPAAQVHRPWEVAPAGYPAPVVDLKRTREEALAALQALKGSAEKAGS